MKESIILICTDLDRTLIPNGLQDESSDARHLFKQLVSHDDIRLAYVSGRDRRLVLDAIHEYDLPVPDYAICDVGSTIFSISQTQWLSHDDWHNKIALDWGTHNHSSLVNLLTDIPALILQEDLKQAELKLSYYVDKTIDTDSLFQEIHGRLLEQGVHANLIWSIDDITQVGLLDILPEHASKLHAINFLMESEGFVHRNTVFAGDSGNDLEIMGSRLQSILVKNAASEIKQKAISLANENNRAENLYLSQGNYQGMNGNYSAGILEGIVHYFPKLHERLTARN